jgi:Ca-activated chloride channel homolog
MDLLWPGSLLLLGIVPLIVAAYIWVLRRRRVAVRYSSLSLLREVLPRQSWIQQHLPFVMFVIALASLVLAMSRPVAKVSIPAGQTAIILALDVSLSMCSTDIPPNRLEAAKEAAKIFVERQNPHTQIGVVAFAGFAALIQEPTSDQELLHDSIDSLTPARRTAIGSAILEALEAISEIDERVAPIFSEPDQPATTFSGEFVPHIIVLLTDGVANAGPFPLDAAQLAVDRGVRVYTIGFGTASESSVFGGPQCEGAFGLGGPSFGNPQFGGGGFSRAIDEETLIQIADMTGGDYYAATSASELQNVFQSLPTYLLTEEQTTEISVMFTAVGAVLMALVGLLSMLWRPLP